MCCADTEHKPISEVLSTSRLAKAVSIQGEPMYRHLMHNLLGAGTGLAFRLCCSSSACSEAGHFCEGHRSCAWRGPPKRQMSFALNAFKEKYLLQARFSTWTNRLSDKWRFAVLSTAENRAWCVIPRVSEKLSG
jgi:hypothetical protein